MYPSCTMINVGLYTVFQNTVEWEMLVVENFGEFTNVGKKYFGELTQAQSLNVTVPAKIFLNGTFDTTCFFMS